MRTYGQFCAVAHALDLVGDRWSLLVVRDLLLGPRRFTDLQRSLPGIGTNILTARLKHLEEAGVVRRAALPPPAAGSAYELTDYGRGLEPAIAALAAWGARSIGMPEPGRVPRAEWLGAALHTFASPAAARGRAATYELRLDDGVLTVELGRRRARVLHGPAQRPDLVVEAGNTVLIGLLAGVIDADDAVASGSLRLTGNPTLLAGLLRAFPLPPPGPALGQREATAA
jgi:DNA-binding HxlR family transcriptional regulator